MPLELFIINLLITISEAKCSSVVSLMDWYWRYSSHAPSYQYENILLFRQCTSWCSSVAIFAPQNNKIIFLCYRQGAHKPRRLSSSLCSYFNWIFLCDETCDKRGVTGNLCYIMLFYFSSNVVIVFLPLCFCAYFYKCLFLCYRKQ